MTEEIEGTDLFLNLPRPCSISHGLYSHVLSVERMHVVLGPAGVGGLRVNCAFGKLVSKLPGGPYV